MRRFLGVCGAIGVIFWITNALRARGDGPWQNRGGGLESRVFSWHGARVHAFRSKAARVEVASGAYLEAPGWLRRKKARVAINGGYFDGSGHSMGLRVSQKKQSSPLRRADWGVFWVKNGRAHLSHTRDFDAKTRPEEALQCGPRLVVKGKITDLKPQMSRRSGVGIDARGRVVLAVADGALSLADWAQVWSAKDGLSCRDALNLDGGPSSQLAFENKNRRISSENVPGGWPVPDALVIR